MFHLTGCTEHKSDNAYILQKLHLHYNVMLLIFHRNKQEEVHHELHTLHVGIVNTYLTENMPFYVKITNNQKYVNGDKLYMLITVLTNTLK